MAKKHKKQSGPCVVADVVSQVTRELPVLKEGTAAGFFVYADEKNINYTYAFHQIYNRADETSDENFRKEIKERFSMSEIELRSCVTEATALRESEIALNELREQDIEELKELYNNEETTAKQRFNIFNKIASLIRQHTANAVFGGRAALRQLTKAHNQIAEADNKIPRLMEEIEKLETKLQDKGISKRDYKRAKYLISSKKRDINRFKELKKKALKRIPGLKEELRENRILDASLTGEANKKGNRFVDFNLMKGEMTFKITKNESYKVHVKIPKGFRDEFRLLQELIDKKEISVTVHINRNYIKLSYDIAVLNGYALDKKTRRKEVNEIKAVGYPEDVEKEKIKEAYRVQYEIQNRKMLSGKIEGRCISIDMNPGEIGYAVLQKDDTKKEGYRVISAGCLSWHHLMGRAGKSSSSAKTRRRNNKRKNAVCLALKMLFEVAAHYKCSEFIMENLEFSDNDSSEKSKESNRKCKNLWHRTLTEQIINRRCAETGIRLVKTNACYTSFIGNIKHDFCDPTNASVEIGRRGLLRYTSGSFYPQMTMRDCDTMTSVAADGDRGDAHDFTCESWKEAYKSCRKCFSQKAHFENRYRTALGESPYRFTRVRQGYYNSGIKFIVFYKL